MKNLYNHPRGTICVSREYRGEYIMLAIADQRRFNEWSYCFSVI